MLFHFTQTKASCQIPKDKSLHHSKCLLIIWNISNFYTKFWLFSGAQLAPGEQMLSFVPVLLYRLIICNFNFISSNNGTDNKSSPLSYFAQKTSLNFGAKLISDNCYVSGPEWFLFLYFKYWYFRSLKHFWDCDFNFVSVLELHHIMEER